MARKRGTNGADRLNGTNGNDVIFGLGGNDRINGKGGDDRIDGGNGNDIIAGGSGNDNIKGGAGNDFIVAGTGNDKADGGTGVDIVSGGDGDDNVSGGDGNDSVSGDAGNDTVSGDAGADTLSGGTGDDVLKPGADLDADSVNGGAGMDTVDYSNATAGVTVNLTASTSSGAAAGDSYTSVESVNGSNFADTLTAKDGGTAFGGGGVDTLNGAGVGTTTILRGGDGADLLSGNSFGQELMQLELGHGVDIISNIFRTADLDRLLVDNAEFNIGLTVTTSEIVTGAGAQVANQAFAQFLFNQTTGDLFFDSDGTGAGAAVQIANLNFANGGQVLLATDFFVV